jgi:microcompartment protein CcmK/EutM
MLILAVLVLSIVGCNEQKKFDATGVYNGRQLWAVAPLRNESGSMAADGTRVADHFAHQLEEIRGIDVVAVNRVIAAMDALGIVSIGSPAEAEMVRRTLGVDALVVGTITAYEPYDPPKLGLAVELFIGENRQSGGDIDDIRRLSAAATDRMSQPSQPMKMKGPASSVSGFFDAAVPEVRDELHRYAERRGVARKDADSWRLYRHNMDLYTEFVAYVVSYRLMQAEIQRAAASPPAEQPAS